MVTLIKGQNVGEKSPLCSILSVATSPCWRQNGVTPNYVAKHSANLSTLQCVISIWTAFSAYCAEKAAFVFCVSNKR